MRGIKILSVATILIVLFALSLSAAKRRDRVVPLNRIQETTQAVQQAPQVVTSERIITPDSVVTPVIPAATPAAGETIDWQVLAGGGTVATGGGYTIEGTLGQPVAGLVVSGATEVNQGYWQDFSTGSCCVGTTGNVNMLDIVDLSDLSLLIAYLTNPPATKPTVPCPEEANINALDIIDISDLSLLVSYLTNPPATKPPLPACP